MFNLYYPSLKVAIASLYNKRSKKAIFEQLEIIKIIWKESDYYTFEELENHDLIHKMRCASPSYYLEDDNLVNLYKTGKCIGIILDSVLEILYKAWEIDADLV